MTFLAQATFWTLCALILGQGVLVAGFVVALRRWRRPLLGDAEAPKAAVILCLRGGDPFLVDCLQGLLEQDYPNYEIHIVVDHRDDPANAILGELISEAQPKHVFVQYLSTPRETCSLKCSSVVQAASALDESYSFIAQLDADTIPHPTWLRELATALNDERVGAATGNRWYMPARVSIGSMVRYFWNAAAVVQMYSYGIAWGGTLAVKTSVLRDTDLLERWSNAFCEDTMLYAFLKKHNLRVAFVPSLMMINRESCDVGGFYTWVRRQLLTARLYHPAWLAVVGHGLTTFVAPLLAFLGFLWCVVTRDASAALWFGSGFIVYQIGVAIMLPPLEHAVRGIVRARGKPTQWIGIRGACLFLLAMPLTQFVYTFGLGSACLLKTVDWRGVTYHIGRSKSIRLQKYEPYEHRRDEPTAASL